MGGICTTHVGDKRRMPNFNWKTRGEMNVSLGNLDKYQKILE
jgi:hypothetical protein